INVDLLGVKELKADGEIVVVAHTILSAFGAMNDDFVIRVNSRTLLDAACKTCGLSAEAAKAYLRLLDKKAKMPAQEFKLAQTAITAEDPLARIEANDPGIREEKEKLMGLIIAWKARGMTNVVFDPTIVRGFDYYTGVIFEVFDTNSENPRALLGGGRYDDLVSLFGGDPVPAVGFGMGDVTLVDFLTTHDLLPEVTTGPEIYVGTPKESDLTHANLLADAMRGQGLRVFVNITSKSLGEQIKDADRRGIRYFAAVGEDERASGTLRVKRLQTGEERVLALSDVVHFVRS